HRSFRGDLRLLTLQQLYRAALGIQYLIYDRGYVDAIPGAGRTRGDIQIDHERPRIPLSEGVEHTGLGRFFEQFLDARDDLQYLVRRNLLHNFARSLVDKLGHQDLIFIVVHRNFVMLGVNRGSRLPARRKTRFVDTGDLSRDPLFGLISRWLKLIGSDLYRVDAHLHLQSA